LTAYDYKLDKAMTNMQNSGANAPEPSIVAETIYEAVTDNSNKIRYGVNTKGLLLARKFLPDALFLKILKGIILK
jgi:hypothetical protein